MHSDSAPTAPSRASGFLLALEGFADEVCATFARLFAYVGALALIAILGLAAWQQFGGLDPEEPAPRSAWSVVDGAVPAFGLRLTDQPDRSATYTVLRHPSGGRKDILRWGEPAGRPAAELEAYRIGTERDGPDARADLALRLTRSPELELETAGVIDSKFGPVSLVRQAGSADGPGACLGFLKNIAYPALRISGWSCLGATTPVRRVAVGCMLNRLTLLPGGSGADLAELFARADQRRAACEPVTHVSGSTDWVTSADDPRLRGAL